MSGYECGPEAPCDQQRCDEEITQDEMSACDRCGRWFCHERHLFVDPQLDTQLCRACHPGPLPEGDPIWVDCEGSGTCTELCLCPVCGQAVVLPGGLVIGHQRDDSVARYERGDYALIVDGGI